jgi:hypothetical protein
MAATAADTERARGNAHKLAGIAALEEGRTERALAEFYAAAADLGPEANVDMLIAAAEALRVKQRGQVTAPAAQPVDVASPAPQEEGESPVGVTQPVAVSPPAPPPTQRPAATGPARPPSGGPARQGVYRPRRAVAETEAPEPQPEAQRRAEAVQPVPPEVAPVPAAAVAPVSEPPKAPPEAPVISPPAPSSLVPSRATTGGLDVTSPGLYAEVWINDRPYGYPPVEARELGAGQTRVEVRVNGEVKRATEVTVIPGEVLKVRVR